MCKNCDTQVKKDRKKVLKAERQKVERARSLKSKTTHTFIAGVEVPMSDVEKRRRMAAAEAM